MDAREYESWRAWPITWSGVWVGALAAIVVALIIGLIGFAVGAHEMASPRAPRASTIRLITLVFNVLAAFFSFVIGGWLAARIAGIRRSEPAMLHGAVVWTLAVPLLLGLAALGGMAHFGGWYAGLGGPPVWANVATTMDPASAKALRNEAFGAVVGLLIGLVGSVLGGWMASGEPMSLRHWRMRDLERSQRPRRAA